MATTVHPPASQAPQERKSPRGNGGGRDLVPASGNLRAVQDYAPPPASTGIWVFVAAVCMTFAALTSALVVRKGGAADWRHFTLPSILFLNTVILLASSVTLEISRRHVAGFMGGLQATAANPARWLYATLSLGLLFLRGTVHRMA